MKKYAEINFSETPIISVVFTGNQATKDNFPAYLDELTSVYDERKKVIIIFDATNAVVPAVKYQKLQAEWLKKNRELMVNYCLGTVYIVPNILIRFVLKAIFTFQRQPVEYLIYNNAEEAFKYAKSKTMLI
ncbi:STAS/SEC14 domain-containing protein [Flavobacterium sp.]|uniref:STAS/SEC14 domain-containing protein n=1 Tax=Flavobacterium sp. TaxID=239 RepID=UPI00375264C3